VTSGSSTASSAAACTTRTTASGSASPGSASIRARNPAQRRERRQGLGEHRALPGPARDRPQHDRRHCSDQVTGSIISAGVLQQLPPLAGTTVAMALPTWLSVSTFHLEDGRPTQKGRTRPAVKPGRALLV
jgi:hypothetical protein